MTFEYPMTGVRFSEIQEGRLVYVTHDETGDKQAFEIYRRSAPISGVVTFNARHISYRLSKVILKPFSVGSIALALQKLKTETFNDNDFEFWTDKQTTARFSVKTPTSIRSILGGSAGSILDVYGGEYEFDMYTVKIHNHRGQDNGVTVRYGKNLTGLTQTLDTGSLYNAIVPYWADNTSGECVYGNPVTAQGGVKNRAKWNEEHGVIMTDENNAELEFDAFSADMTVMDFSEDFKDEKPTPKQLEEKAKAYLAANTPWITAENIKFDFVALWQTEEYKDIASLERVKLCDTVTVEYPALGVSAKAKVIKVVWDVLADRYESVEVGEARQTFGDTITHEIRKAVEDRPTLTDMEVAIQNATDLLTGGMGGHIVFRMDANGKPAEMFMMDTDDINTAVNVWRLNVNGIGFSNSGINGTYRTAWTLDGNFVADFITTGTLSANLIRAGVLASRDGKSFWDLDDSKFRFYDTSFDSYVEMDEGYVAFGHNGNVFAKIRRFLSGEGGQDIVGIESGETRLYVGVDAITALKGDTWVTAYNSSTSKHADIQGSSSDYVRSDGNDHYTHIRNGNDAYIMQHGAEHYTRIQNGSGFMRVYDDGNSNQFIDLNADGSQRYIRVDAPGQYTLLNQNGVYIRIDDANDVITLYVDSNNYINIDKGNGRVWIQTPELIVNGYGGYTGWVNNMYFHDGRLVQVN